VSGYAREAPERGGLDRLDQGVAADGAFRARLHDRLHLLICEQSKGAHVNRWTTRGWCLLQQHEESTGTSYGDESMSGSALAVEGFTCVQLTQTPMIMPHLKSAATLRGHSTV
jgi:hypothetical protein